MSGIGLTSFHHESIRHMSMGGPRFLSLTALLGSYDARYTVLGLLAIGSEAATY